MKNTKETKTNKKKKDESTKKATNKSCKILHWYKGNRVLAIGVLFAMISFLSGYYLKGMFIAATVNGKPIWRFKVVKQLERYYGSNVLDNLITQKLIETEAQKSGVSVSDQEIDEAIKELEENMANSGTNLDQALKESNMTREDLKKDYATNLLIEKVLTSRITVTDDEIQSYIESNQDSFPEGTDMEQAKELVKQQLTQDKMNTEYQTLVGELRENAKINSLVDYYTLN